jgi:hypothetical protein
VYSTFLPNFASNYFTNGAALRTNSVGDSSGIAVMRNTFCADWAKPAPDIAKSEATTNDLQIKRRIKTLCLKNRLQRLLFSQKRQANAA